MGNTTQGRDSNSNGKGGDVELALSSLDAISLSL
jgi:hypothetical protein